MKFNYWFVVLFLTLFAFSCQKKSIQESEFVKSTPTRKIEYKSPYHYNKVLKPALSIDNDKKSNQFESNSSENQQLIFVDNSNDKQAVSDKIQKHKISNKKLFTLPFDEEPVKRITHRYALIGFFFFFFPVASFLSSFAGLYFCVKALLDIKKNKSLYKNKGFALAPIITYGVTNFLLGIWLYYVGITYEPIALVFSAILLLFGIAALSFLIYYYYDPE